MKKQESFKIKTVNRFIALLAQLDSPDPVSDVEMDLTKKLIDVHLKEYKFLEEYRNIYYILTDTGVASGKYLMSEIHKPWDALAGRKVAIPYGIYNDPKEILVWIFKDRWTAEERMIMVSSVMKFLHENKDKELSGNSYEHLEAFAYSEAVCDILRETPYVKAEIVKDPAYYWNRADYFLYEIFNGKVFTGESKTEVNALRHMHAVMGMMWRQPSYATAFPPAVETADDAEQVTSSEVQAQASAEEE